MSLSRSGLFTRTLSLFVWSFALAATGARAEIIEGEDAPESAFTEVFAIVYSAGNGTSARKFCSAVLVHPEVLVTAAHCLPEDPTIPITVIEGPNARAPTATYTSLRSERNSIYFSTKDEIEQTGFDLGVVILGAGVPGADAKTGAKLAGLASMANPADRDAARAAGVIVAGYGGKKSTRIDLTTGTKRWSKTSIVESTGNAFSTDGPHAGLSRGDSGGPAFLVGADGSHRLLGIASGTPKDADGSSPDQPLLSLYAALRPKLACWIEKKSGKTLPSLPGSLGCPSSAPNPPIPNPFGTNAFGSK